MKLPYIRIKQRNEIFYIVKFKANELKEKVNFHFREPYSNTSENIIKYQEYINQIKKKGIEINAEEEGIQRRIQIARINDIVRYLEKEEDSYFPTSIVLALDTSRVDFNTDAFIDEISENDFGEMILPDGVVFQIVDGQHRLAGLFSSNEEICNDFEISAVLLINATKHTCAKIFSDINGNQKQVNRSGIYDLLGIMNPKDEERIWDKNLHLICNKLNRDKNSPLYRHIKMLGLGSGSISQAFFIQCLNGAIKSTDIGKDIQTIYDCIYLYLSAFQRVFQNDWPVLIMKNYYDSKIEDAFNQYKLKISNDKNNLNYYMDEKTYISDLYSDYVLKKKKSQLLKTNGFGAIMLLYPYIYKLLGSSRNYKDYYNIIILLKEDIDWCNDSILKQGTGKKTQKLIMEKLLNILRKNGY